MPLANRSESYETAAANRRSTGARGAAQDGQAAVELVALLPLVVLVAAVLWQIALAGHATWAAGAAARAAARASAVGGDPGRAARSAIPVELRGDLRISETADGAIRVFVRIPAVTPGLDLGRASARAHFPAQGS